MTNIPRWKIIQEPDAQPGKHPEAGALVALLECPKGHQVRMTFRDGYKARDAAKALPCHHCREAVKDVGMFGLPPEWVDGG